MNFKLSNKTCFMLSDHDKYKSTLSEAHNRYLTYTIKDLKKKRAMDLLSGKITIDAKNGLHMRFKDIAPSKQTLKNIYLPNDTRLLYPCGRTLRNDTFRSHINSHKCSLCVNSMYK